MGGGADKGLARAHSWFSSTFDFQSVAGEFQLDWNERRWSEASVFSVERGFMEPSYPHPAQPIAKHFGRRYSQASRSSDYDDTPTVTETSLPWRRDSAAAIKFLANSTVTTPSMPAATPAERSRFRNFKNSLDTEISCSAQVRCWSPLCSEAHTLLHYYAYLRELECGSPSQLLIITFWLTCLHACHSLY